MPRRLAPVAICRGYLFVECGPETDARNAERYDLSENEQSMFSIFVSPNGHGITGSLTAQQLTC